MLQKDGWVKKIVLNNKQEKAVQKKSAKKSGSYESQNCGVFDTMHYK